MNSDPHRNQDGRHWANKAVVYSLAALVSGGATGALLGFAGGLCPPSVRSALASLAALVAIACGCLELLRPHFRPPQCDRETPQRWLHAGPLRWALRNGLALGNGMTSRIGFWLWYVVPAAALLAGQPLFGALLYGIYGFARGGLVWLLILGLGQTNRLHLLDLTPAARRLAAGQLLAVGVMVVAVVGL